jgi:colicin import membrane protein
MNSFSHFFGKKDHGYADSSHSGRHMAVFLGISVFAHALFFLACIWLVQFEVSAPLSEVVQVDLVSFAPGEPGGREQTLAEPVQPVPAAEETQEKEPVDAEDTVAVPDTPEQPAVNNPPDPEPVPTVTPDIGLKTKPKNLQELMAEQSKKTPEKKQKKPEPQPKPDPKKELEKARQKLADDMEARKKEQLARTMERLAQSVQQQDAEPHARSDGNSTGPSVGSGTAAGAGRKGVSPIDIYKMVLKSAIEQNWVFNEMLAGMDQNIEVRILIKILKNGDIRDVVYETKSGNRYLDQSAKRAIQRASPLQPLPKGMASYDVVVVFTPKGLK